MKTLIIDGNRLLQALLDTYHVERHGSWLVVFTPLAAGPFVAARVARDGTALANGEQGYDVRLFVEHGERLAWGEADHGSNDDGSWDVVDEQHVEDRIEHHLREVVTLDGIEYELQFSESVCLSSDVARAVGASISTVNRWCRMGWFPHARREGRDWWIPTGDLLYWHRRSAGRPPKKRPGNQ
jgi:hypothetical protein